MDEKETLHHYLRTRRAHLVGKLDGLAEYDIRRPMTPTGTNLLGLVKHVSSVELGYFGECFARPSGLDLPWFEDDAEVNADMWATADETRADILALHDAAAAHSAATIEALPLDATGEVPWWPEQRRHPTLHTVLVHMCVEMAHHAGHADILRETIDGAIGRSVNDPNLPFSDSAEWRALHDRIEDAARQAAGR